MQFETFETTDKAQRNSIFRDLRANGTAAEKKAVKWSTCRPTGKLIPAGQPMAGLLEWVTVYVVGHPVEPPVTAVA